MAGISSRMAMNLDVSIGILCHHDTWGEQVRTACVKMGLKNITTVDFKKGQFEQPLGFNLIFIAEDYYDSVSGGELLNSLLTNGILNANTAIVMVGESRASSVQDYDSNLVLLDLLSKGFSQQDFQTTISHLLQSQKLFFRVLAFVASGRMEFAYKALKQIDAKNIHPSYIVEYFKLQSKLAFELGKFKEVLMICNKPQLINYDWTVWPRFKANYEVGNWQNYQKLIESTEFSDLPDGSMKLFWQVRVLIEQSQYEDALELVENFPKQHMPLSLVRLNFALLSLTGEWEKAQAFVDRKIRLLSDSPMLQATLINAQCLLYLYQVYAADEDKEQQLAVKNLQELLKKFELHKMAFKFKNSIKLFRVYLNIIAIKLSDSEQVALIDAELDTIEQNISSSLLYCRIAFARYLLGNAEGCFNSLLKADSAFSSTPLGCERLLQSIMFKQTLYLIYPVSKLAQVYHKFGLSHLNEQRYKLACKSFSRSLQLEKDNKKVFSLLANAMSKAGIDVFAGFSIQKKAS